MTLFDPLGKPIVDTDEQWRAAALFCWLSDVRVRDILIRRRRATAQGIRTFGGILDASLRQKVPVDPAILRKEMLMALSDRVCRRVVARVVIENERADYEAYLGHLSVGGDPAPPGEEPRPARHPKAVFKELQDEREALEALDVPESLIITP